MKIFKKETLSAGKGSRRHSRFEKKSREINVAGKCSRKG